MSHSFPSHPGSHVHVKSFNSSLQVPCTQGFLAQSSISAEENKVFERERERERERESERERKRERDREREMEKEREGERERERERETETETERMSSQVENVSEN